MPHTDDKLYLSGIDAETGSYLVEPMSLRSAAQEVTSEKADPKITSWLRRLWRLLTEAHLGVPSDVDPAKVEEAGWAVVFHEAESDDVRKALQPLIDHRARSVPSDRVKVLQYKSGESRATWLARHGIGAGSVIPQRVPYYVLLVGGPDRIPFLFGHHLDVEYAVGRIQFDSTAEYRRYVESVIACETGTPPPLRREVAVFAPLHAGDPATSYSTQFLVNPLLAWLATRGIATQALTGAAARRDKLMELLAPPASQERAGLLFTAGHGLGFKQPHPDRAAIHGALLCQDWSPFSPLHPGDSLKAADVPPDARVQGSVIFSLACFGAGTPERDPFWRTTGTDPKATLPPFVAALPRRLLAHENGGALAWIGHVGRAWSTSFLTDGAGPQLLPFQNMLDRIIRGQPVGHAVRDFRERYAALSTTLSSLLEEMDFGRKVPDQELVSAWLERNDAEGYVVLGDPAVRLRVGEAPSKQA